MAPDEDEGREGDDAPPELRTDPETGSTPTDPAAEESGPPPAGEDPMAGPAPSG